MHKQSGTSEIGREISCCERQLRGASHTRTTSTTNQVLACCLFFFLCSMISLIIEFDQLVGNSSRSKYAKVCKQQRDVLRRRVVNRWVVDLLLVRKHIVLLLSVDVHVYVALLLLCNVPQHQRVEMQHHVQARGASVSVSWKAGLVD